MDALELLKKKQLTAEEERAVFEYYKLHRTQEVRNLIVERNTGLCRYIARRFSGLGLEDEELVQEGVIGLITAVEKFDESRGLKFSTYACHWIRQAIGRSVVNTGKMIRLPVHMADKVWKVCEFQKKYKNEYNKMPTEKEIAEELGMGMESVESVLCVMEMQKLTSLNRRLLEGDDDKDKEIIDILADEKNSGFAEQVEQEYDYQAVREQVDRVLSTREREVIYMRFGFDGRRPLTLEEVGRHMGVTRERIRQIENKALAKLRRGGRNLQGLVS